MTQNRKLIEIVVPCYNPLPDWEVNLIHSFQEFEKSIEADCALILINDGSSKGVQAQHIEAISAQIEKFTYIHYKENKGKGYALRKGLEQAGGGRIILTDIDFPYVNTSMISIWNSLEEGNDIALGYREESYYRKVPFARLLISKTFRLVLRSLMNMNVNDTQCGLKGLNEKGKEVFLRSETNGYLYDLEFVKDAQKAGLKIGRTVVELKDGVEFTNMKFSILWKEARNFLRILVK